MSSSRDTSTFLAKGASFFANILGRGFMAVMALFLGEAVSDHGLKYLDVTESHSFVPRIANTSQVQFDLCIKNKPNGFWKEWGIKEGMEEDGRHGCSVKVSEDDTAPRFVFFSFLSSVFRSFEARDLSKVPRIP